MADREKVIDGFEKLREYADSEVHPVVSPDNWNIYSELRDLIDKAEKDTLALLKSQEPVEPIRKVIGCGWRYFCGKCGNSIVSQQHFCQECGMAVKWYD